MKFVLIPDSFKGTLSSEQICEIAKEKVEKHFPGAETACVPVADGGEGSVDAFITALGGSKVTVKVKNPYFEDMDSYYGLINEGKTAVIEMASCAGLPLVEDRKDPRKTTTYGVGQLILAAAESGVEKIIVGLGGSSTNDRWLRMQQQQLALNSVTETERNSFQPAEPPQISVRST